MKKIVLSALLIVTTSFLNAQTFSIDTLRYKGDPVNRINLVFLGDGYRSTEQLTYISDVNGIVNDLFQEVPFSRYQEYFNVIAVKVISVQSGANHPGTAADEPTFNPPPVRTANNYFGSSFDSFGIHRLLVPTQGGRINTVLATHFPMYDQAFILVNSPIYGGSGGIYATSSTHATASEIAIHEIGHSFAGLADEYWFSGSGESPNKTRQSSPVSNRWRNWLNTSGTGIGIYQHSGAGTGWYKPHNSCKMQFLGFSFCAVCKETFVERIHTLVNPIDDHSPNGSAVNFTGNAQTFSLDLIKPNPNTLKVEWFLNNQRIGFNVDSVVINQTSLLNGNNTLTAAVIDTTLLSKSTTHLSLHVNTINWTINKLAVSVNSTSIADRIELKVFPNPSSDFVELSYFLNKPSTISISLVDMQGRLLDNNSMGLVSSGKHNNRIDLSTYAAGNYMLRIEINGAIIHHKLVKVSEQ